MTVISIMLEELASVGLVRLSQIVLLILAGVTVLVGAVVRDAAASVGGIVVAGIFVALYFGTRQTILAFQLPARAYARTLAE